ncbi:hypothetical protein FPQ18DRAFT_385498 [Pyronema domesticum]|nr:hypothetical protein FPQ18DRAFT_385498 [Pyronema domesticum]
MSSAIQPSQHDEEKETQVPITYMKFPASPQSLDDSHDSHDTPAIPIISPITRKRGYSDFSCGYMPALLELYEPVKKRERTEVDHHEFFQGQEYYPFRYGSFDGGFQGCDLGAVSGSSGFAGFASFPDFQDFQACSPTCTCLMKKERGYLIQKPRNVLDEMLDRLPKLPRARMRNKMTLEIIGGLPVALFWRIATSTTCPLRHPPIDSRVLDGKSSITEDQKLERISEEMAIIKEKGGGREGYMEDTEMSDYA